MSDKPKFVPIPTRYGVLMDVVEFRDCVRCGAFIPDDGIGFWATATLESNQGVWSTKRPEWATHVMWYNR